MRAEDDPLTYAYLKALGRYIGVEISVNTSFNVAGPIAQTPLQAIDTLRRSRGLDVVVMVADDGTVTATWHGANCDSGRFAGWFSEWNTREHVADPRLAHPRALHVAAILPCCAAGCLTGRRAIS